MATNLEEAAHAAAQAVRVLAEGVQAAREQCGDSMAEVDAFSRCLESDRADLNRALGELEQTLDDLGQRVPQQARAAESALLTLAREAGALGPPDALGTILSNVPGVLGSATEVLDAESSALGGLADRVRQVGSTLEPIAVAAESASRAALERAAAIEESLRQTIDEAEQLVSLQLASGLAEIADAVNARAAKVESFLSRACVALLEDKEEDWNEKRQAASAVLDKTRLDMKGHAEGLAREALEECADHVQEAANEGAARIAEIGKDLLELERAVTEGAGPVQQAASLASDLQSAARAAHAAAEVVGTTRERWCGYGFGC